MALCHWLLLVSRYQSLTLFQNCLTFLSLVLLLLLWLRILQRTPVIKVFHFYRSENKVLLIILILPCG
ncbi:hypothetical protein QVD17_00094 [Tagetes erecta]|uniref:Uncharacterized protein n=1 Tax=Tagetes erecta TaxID=13708 RepID=A0AAD8P0B7_TARER|nr:hypothetical protein QVD17_00094 [Tagetes erecta]